MIRDKVVRRAARSHRFDCLTHFCVFCRRPLTHFHEHGFGYCSASWTGRPERAPRPDRAHWKFGPIEWTRAGILAVLQIGPISAAMFVNRLPMMHIRFGAMRLEEV